MQDDVEDGDRGDVGSVAARYVVALEAVRYRVGVGDVHAILDGFEEKCAEGTRCTLCPFRSECVKYALAGGKRRAREWLIRQDAQAGMRLVGFG